MKTVIAVIIAALATSVWASCPNGCEPHSGVCACDEVAEGSSAGPTTDPTIVSQELPSKHPQAEWERGDVKADTPQSLIAEDAKQDRERAAANAEGMKNAGIPLDTIER